MFLDDITDESVKKHGFKAFQIFSVLFLIFFIPIGSPINQVFAEELPDVYRGYDYLDVANPDGTRTMSIGLPPFIFNGTEFVPFIFSNGNQVETEHGSVILNSDGSYSFYKKGIIDGTPLFTDKIVGKYADVSNLNSWIYPETLNIDTPDNSWDGNNFTSSKIKTGIGKLDYKYILNNGEWKTQLEATNLSSLTTKVFGFDQTIDLNSDTIKFGGVTRNLDNFNGQTFDKQFLIANEGKVLDLLNGINFDFDLGFENLYSITVYDIGVDKSRLVFDYRTSEPLLPNETLIIDPTYSTNDAQGEGRIWDNDNDDSCESSPSSFTDSDLSGIVGRPTSASTYDCSRTWLQYSISSIPDTALIVSINWEVNIGSADASALNCDVNALTSNQPVATLRDTVWGDIASGNTYLSNNNWCTTTGEKHPDLGTDAVTDLQNQLTDDWFAIGIKGTNDVGALDGTSRTSTITFGSNSLEVIYQTAPSAPTNVLASAQSSSGIDLSWTTPSSPGTGTISGYKIFNSTDGSTWNTLVNNTGTIDTTYSVTGLDSGTQFYFKVAGWNEFNLGSNSSSFNNYTLTEAPTSLTATAIDSQDEIRLLWSAPSGTVTGYKIERESPTDGGFSVLTANTGNTTASYNNTSLDINTQYNYRISAINSGGASLASSSASNATGTIAPSATATRASPTQITITWDTPATASEITNYKIYNSTDDSTYDLLTTLGIANSYTDSGLTTGQTYYYKVAGVTSWGDGANSTATYATVTADPPAQGGGGSGGSGSGGGSGSNTGVPASNALLLNLNSRSFPLNLGDVRTYSLEIIWDETKESTLFIKNIKIGQGQFDSLLIVPESLPELGKKIIAGKGDILLTVNVPPDQCGSTQITARCVNLKTYTIPVMITVEDIIGTSYPDIPATITLVIQDKFPIGIAIIIILLLSFMYPIYKIISRNSKKTRSPKNMKKYHDKILEKSKQIDHKKIKHNKNILKKIKKGF